MQLLVQLVLDGIADGAIYASMALAVVLVFMSTGTINLAQGAMGMFSAFVTWFVAVQHGWPLGLAILLGIGLGVLSGAVLERTLVRPLERDQELLPMIIVTLGLFLAISAAAGWLFTTEAVTLRSPFPDGALALGPIEVRYQLLGLVGTVLVVSVAMWFLFQRTRLGLAMRATVDNPESSLLVGVRRGRLLMLGWGLAGGLGALAAILIAPVTLVSTTMMDTVLFLGFAAATLGGLLSPAGAIVGGFIIGLVENLAPAYVPGISNQLGLLAVFVVLVAILVFRPNGLFGRAESVRL